MRGGWVRAKAAATTLGVAVLLVALLAGCAAGAPTTIAPPAPEREVAAQAPQAAQALQAAQPPQAAQPGQVAPASQSAPASEAEAPAPAPAPAADPAPAAPSDPNAASAPSTAEDQTAPSAPANDPAPSTAAQAPASGAPPPAPNASSPSIDSPSTDPEQAAVADDAVADSADTAESGAAGDAAAGADALGSTLDGGRGRGSVAFAAQVDATGRPPAPPAPGDGTTLDYWRGPSGRLEVALTFDAGADRGYGEAILDELASQGVIATFGMTGKWAEENPDLITRMVAEGHQLINHTWNHPSLTGATTGAEPMTYEDVLQEVTSTANLVRDLTGYELAPYVRPPYGDYGPATSGYLAQAGYYVNVLWSCDSFGWNGAGADQIVEACTSAEQGGPGAIILMHLGAQYAGDLAALPGLIAAYRDQGYAFVTIERMLQP